MVQLTTIVAAAAATLAITATTAHAHAMQGQPHIQHHQQRSLLEAANSRLFKQNAHRSLKACDSSKRLRQLQQQAAEKRQRKLQAIRQETTATRQRERQRQRQRQLAAADVLATSHKSNLTGISSFEDADIATLFGTTPKCVLEPEVTQGPYYVAGELIRSDIRETQAGVDLYAELQIIDVNTCEPLSGIYLDFWHCNATGVYAGVVANGNGDASDASNLDATFMRGLAPTDDDGIAQFTTKFPGHYTSRATHIHVLGSQNGQVLANNTYSGGKVASVGQLFFDQDLISAVEATGSYATNTQELTTNAADSIFSEETASGFDPIMQYVYVGDSVEDGVFAWISIGVDATVAKTVSAAATLTAEGGVAGTSMGGGAGGNGNGGGAPPSGSFGGPRGSMGGAPPGDFAGSMGVASPDAGTTSAAGSSIGAEADTSSSASTTATPEATTTTTPAPSSACE